jgi:hypothetical protein
MFTLRPVADCTLVVVAGRQSVPASASVPAHRYHSADLAALSARCERILVYTFGPVHHAHTLRVQRRSQMRLFRRLMHVYMGGEVEQ